MKKEELKYSLLAFLLAFALPIFTFLFIHFRKLYFEANNIEFMIFHTVSELFSTLIGIAIFIISAYAYRKTGNRRLIIFGGAFLFMAIIDYFHAIYFPDVRISWEEIKNSANITVWFWVISKFVGSALILLSAIIPERYVSEDNAMRNSILLLTFNSLILFFFLIFYTIEKNIEIFTIIFKKDVSIPILFAIFVIVILVSFFVSYYLIKYLSKRFIENEESRNIFSLSLVITILIFSFIIFYIITNYQHKIPILIDIEVDIKKITQLNIFIIIAIVILITLTTTRYLLSYVERKNIVLFMFTIGFIFFIFSIISTIPGGLNDLYVIIGHIFNIFFNIAILFALLVLIKS